MKTRILIVDDHALVREGLRSVLDREADFDVVGEASTGREAVQRAGELEPDLVLMDVAMRDLNGIEATRQLIARRPETRVVALSSYADRRYVTAILEAGAAAYVLKACAYNELRRALRAVQQGQRYLCAEVAGMVIDARVGGGAGPQASPFAILAPREREVLQLIAEGLTSAAIATRLSLSPHTVETHRRNLMRKLSLHNVADLTRYAIREGLARPD